MKCLVYSLQLFKGRFPLPALVKGSGGDLKAVFFAIDGGIGNYIAYICTQ
jgi:hypothetical protein